MRVSVIPTIYGEKIVIRLLKKDTKPPELKTL
jgi:type II secretory ATPase GspE/PulE/Tfp pilus assembly ATPase PilB-like protein